jgi:hypothetical protein
VCCRRGGNVEWVTLRLAYLTFSQLMQWAVLMARDGHVALRVGMIETDLGGEVVEPSSSVVASEVCVRLLAVPTGSERRRHSLVSTVQPVLSGRGGTAGRTRRGGRPRHRVPVGAAVHSAAGRRHRFARHSPGNRWYVDETYVKVNGVWRDVYRAVDQYG